MGCYLKGAIPNTSYKGIYIYCQYAYLYSPEDEKNYQFV